MTSGLRFLRTLHILVLVALWLGDLIGAPALGGRLSDATRSYLSMHADDGHIEGLN